MTAETANNLFSFLMYTPAVVFLLGVGYIARKALKRF